LSAGASPQTLLGELTALPRPLAGLRGPTSKGSGGKGKEAEGRGPTSKGRGGEEREWRGRERRGKGGEGREEGDGRTNPKPAATGLISAPQ